MKVILTGLLLSVCIASCQKNSTPAPQTGCDMAKIYADNAQKLTIPNGVWGTVSDMEGNCMPMVLPSSGSCRHCPVKRTVKIYAYTHFSNAVQSQPNTSFYDSFTTALIAETETDANGFYQVILPPGNYSIVIVENGKLYASGMDGQGGLSPFTQTTGTVKVNLTMTYKAVF